MSVTSRGPRLQRPVAATQGVVAGRRVTPVKVFAALGAANCVLATYVLVRWLTSGDVAPTPRGPDVAPRWVPVLIHFAEAASMLIGGLVIWRMVIRPWRRGDGLTTDGLLLVAWIAAWFPWDLMLNYRAYHFLYNAYFVNVGSWMGAVPGIGVPRAHLIPQPLLYISFGYIWGIYLPMVLGSWCIGRFRRRFPHAGKAGWIGATAAGFVAFVLIDLAGEALMVRAQFWSWAGAIREWSLWPGTRYQIPVYEGIFVGFLFVAGAALRHFRDDRGRLFIERGIDDLRVSKRERTGVRLLAAIGATTSIYFVTYNLPYQFVAVRANAFPAGTPSYLVAGVCGGDTPHPCPD